MEHALNIQQVRTARAHDVLAWFVNPDDPDNAYASVNAAATAGHAALPADEDLVIVLAPGKIHNLVAGAFSPPVSRNTRILCLSLDGGRLNDPSTSIVGTVTLPDATAEPARRIFEMRGVKFLGDFVLSSKWDTFIRSVSHVGSTTRTHGTEGCYLRWDDVNWTGGSFSDLDGNLVGPRGDWSLYESYIEQTDPAHVISFVNGTEMKMTHVFIKSEIGNGAHLFDMNAGINHVEFYDHNALILSAADDYTFIINGGNAKVLSFGRTVFITDKDGAGYFDFGLNVDYGDSTGLIMLTTNDGDDTPEPLNPPLGQILWFDGRTTEQLICNAAGEWCVGDLKRKEIRVDIGGAAADHDCGWDSPGGSATIKTTMKILKALTGAGGAVKPGFGTKAAGDPDKYGLCSGLIANLKSYKLNPTWDNGGADDLGITGCDAAGAAAGTLAGSGDEDVLVLVWYREPIGMP